MLVKIVETVIAENEAGQMVDALPVRAADSATDVDILGRPVDVATAIIDEDFGRPVRVVEGFLAQDSAGQWVDTIPLLGIGGVLALSSSSISEGDPINSVVGILSVINGEGTYTFTITGDPDSKFAIANDDELIIDQMLDFETAESHQVTIEADNGVDDPIERTFTITVINVGGASATFYILGF